MKRIMLRKAAAAVVLAAAAAGFTFAQAAFKIPFPFEAGGKKLPAGEYSVVPKGSDQLALKRLPDGAEVLVAFTKRLEKPAQPVAEPQLIFDMVGNFEPSYTEYVTDYVLAELWMPGEEGFLVRAMKGAHQHKTISGRRTGS